MFSWASSQSCQNMWLFADWLDHCLSLAVSLQQCHLLVSSWLMMWPFGWGAGLLAQLDGGCGSLAGILPSLA